MQAQYLKRDDRFIIVMLLSFVLGMAVALGVYLFWRVHAGQLHNLFSALALVTCPPFILVLSVGSNPDSGLAVALTAGTIVFANAVLYAGVAAGLYFLFTVTRKQRPS